MHVTRTSKIWTDQRSESVELGLDETDIERFYINVDQAKTPDVMAAILFKIVDGAIAIEMSHLMTGYTAQQLVEEFTALLQYYNSTVNFVIKDLSPEVLESIKPCVVSIEALRKAHD